jgi:hypothetical protein
MFGVARVGDPRERHRATHGDERDAADPELRRGSPTTRLSDSRRSGTGI